MKKISPEIEKTITKNKYLKVNKKAKRVRNHNTRELQKKKRTCEKTTTKTNFPFRKAFKKSFKKIKNLHIKI